MDDKDEEHPRRRKNMIVQDTNNGTDSRGLRIKPEAVDMKAKFAAELAGKGSIYGTAIPKGDE